MGSVALAGTLPRGTEYSHVVTSPAGRDEEVFPVRLDASSKTIPLPAVFCSKVESDTLIPVSIVGEHPVRLGAAVRHNHLTVSIDPADLAACGGSLMVYVKISGLRKGIRQTL